MKSVIRDGVNFQLDLSDYMQWHVFANLSEESWKLATQYLSTGAIVFDVSANIGAFSIKLARKAAMKGIQIHIYAFESKSLIIDRLRYNLVINNDLKKMVTIIPKGFGEKKGFLNFILINRTQEVLP